MSHALLSPSSAHRWLSCTPSARLELQFPDKAGEAAAEGTVAHALAELKMQAALGLIIPKVYEKKFLEISKDKFYCDAMNEHCENYVTFVMERYNEALARTKDALIFLERKIDLTTYVEEGYGTGDTVIIADHEMEIIDLKYGKGVMVSAEKNKQMMLYALGALDEFDFIYDITTARMTIYQPRIDNFSSWEINAEELKQWAEDELRPKAALAFSGEGDFNPGEHCRFCRAKAVCRANADAQMEIAKHEFKPGPFLEDQEISEIMGKADTVINWLNSVLDYALDQAVNHAKKWPGFKLVEGRSNRTFSDEKLVATKLLNAGFAEDLIYTKKVNGITALEKNVGKKLFAELLSELIIKPPGKPTLVDINDKRPEYNSTESAIKDFA